MTELAQHHGSVPSDVLQHSASPNAVTMVVGVNRTSHLLPIAGALFLGASIWLSLHAQTSTTVSTTPVLLVANPGEIDFGVGQMRDYCYATLTLKNQSDRAVDIVAVRRSCGCTIPQLDTNHLMPGKQTTLKVWVRIPPETGEHLKSVRVDYRAQRATEVLTADIPLRFTVDAPVRHTPTFLSFCDGGGIVPATNSCTVKVWLSNHAGACPGEQTKSFAIVSATVPNDAFTTTVAQRDAGWYVDVAFDRDQYTGEYPLRTILRIVTTCTAVRIIDIPICATQSNR
jgi:hypothetical protein